MTPEDIKRYLALPEKFRDSRLAHMLGGWQMFDNDGYKIRCPSHHAERLAIASMINGLLDAYGLITLDHCVPMMEVRTNTDEDDDVAIGSGSTRFLTLLAACEEVAKEATL